jgi:hypothetical protein
MIVLFLVVGLNENAEDDDEEEKEVSSSERI